MLRGSAAINTLGNGLSLLDKDNSASESTEEDEEIEVIVEEVQVLLEDAYFESEVEDKDESSDAEEEMYDEDYNSEEEEESSDLDDAEATNDSNLLIAMSVVVMVLGALVAALLVMVTGAVME